MMQPKGDFMLMVIPKGLRVGREGWTHLSIQAQAFVTVFQGDDPQQAQLFITAKVFAGDLPQFAEVDLSRVNIYRIHTRYTGLGEQAQTVFARRSDHQYAEGLVSGQMI